MPEPYEQAVACIWAADPAGVGVLVVEQVAGLLPALDQINIVEWMRGLHPSDGTPLADLCSASFVKRTPFRHVHRILCMDGFTRSVLTTGMPRFLGNGRFAGLTGAIVDVTEQQTAVEQARSSERELRVLLDNSVDLIAHCGPDGRYTHVSPSFTELLGWDAAEMIGQSVDSFLHPDDQVATRAGLMRILDGAAAPEVVEVRKRHRNGGYIRVGTTLRRVSDPTTGLIGGAVLVSRDITRDKDMLRQVGQMAEQNQALLDNSPDIILLLDLEGHILRANTTLQLITGHRPEELIGQDAMNYVTPEGRAGATQDLATLAQGEGFLSSNVPCVCKDGRILQLDWSLRRPPGSSLIYATARDVTENHRTRLALEQANSQVRAILESIDDGFFSVSPDWKITYANTLAAAFVGLDRDAPVGKVLWEVAKGLAESPAGAIYRRAMEERENTSFELFYEPARAWVSARIYAHADGLSVFFHDISDRVKSDRIVRESERRFREMVEITPAGYVLTDAAGMIQEVNAALCHLSGYTREELIGTSVMSILDGGDHDDALRVSPRGTHRRAMETVIRHKQGRTVNALVNQTIERDRTGCPTSLSAFIADITELKQAETRLEHLATRDVLTGLPNRAWLNQHVRRMLDQARSNATTTVLFIDLNRFKEVNDSLGHAAGDGLLQQVSRRLESCMRPGDVVARLGGDEFVVAANCAGRAAAAAIARRLLTALVTPFCIDGLEIQVGASIGISLSNQDIATPERLFQNADTAMYRAKAAGDSAYEFFEPEMRAEVTRRMQLEVALRRALELNQLEVYYQPRVDLTTMRVCGMEALLRWNHPEFGQVPPLQFIPIAEERGYIEEIGKWVLREACLTTKRLSDKYGTVLHVSVNVAARQLRHMHLVAQVEQALHSSGLDAGALELELTESALIEDTDQTADILRRLKRLGVKLSLDDFGTGYSSLSYLKRFPVDILKLDRSFFNKDSFGQGNTGFVKAIIDMAHALALTVVAEGIETEEVMALLLAADCDGGQGYLFAKPLSLQAFEKFLECELAMGLRRGV